MKRVLYVDNSYGTQDKYILSEEYGGFGIYKEVTPSGYFVHQSWLIAGKDNTIVVPSYMTYCKEELLDCIDSYNETKKFCLTAISCKSGLYIAHPSGKPI